MSAVAGLLALALTACGGGGPKLLHSSSSSSSANATPAASGGIPSTAPQAAQKLGIPEVATKNTTRVAGADPIADAAGVALAVFPSAAPGTHPTAVTLAPTGDWQAAIAASVLMASPIHAPVLLSGPTTLPAATATALTELAPVGSGPAGGARVIRVGNVPAIKGAKTTAISGNDPYTLAAGIDRFVSAVAGKASDDVVIASGTSPAYAMPAAGWAAESGNPVLFVGASGIPAATRQALLSHSKPHIYVLGPPSVIPNATLTALGKYGTVKRVSGNNPAANSVAFTVYRDPACPFGQACAHVPGSFGWALRSPGHGYVLLNASRPLDAAAAAALSASGDYGPDLLVQDASTLPKEVLDYFLNYATPGFTEEGPTVAVYNHAWMIGDQSAFSVAVQAEVDRLLEVVPQTQQGQGAGQ
jgi:hypothetical protein